MRSASSSPAASKTGSDSAMSASSSAAAPVVDSLWSRCSASWIRPHSSPDPIAGRGRARHDRLRAAQRLFSLAVPRERVDQVGLEAEVQLACRDKVGGALQEAGGAAEVEPPQRTATGRGEALAGCLREAVVRALPELQPVAHRLLEVVAE